MHHRLRLQIKDLFLSFALLYPNVIATQRPLYVSAIYPLMKFVVYSSSSSSFFVFFVDVFAAAAFFGFTTIFLSFSLSLSLTSCLCPFFIQSPLLWLRACVSPCIAFV